MTMSDRYVLADFEFDKSRGVLLGKSKNHRAAFPQELVVVSHITGREVLFVQVSPEVQMENEFWDGELMEYVPADSDTKVKCLVLTY
jgi:hypothetical protein